MVKKGYGALIIGANSSCSNLNFFKKGDYPYNLRTFAPSSGNYKLITPLKANTFISFILDSSFGKPFIEKRFKFRKGMI